MLILYEYILKISYRTKIFLVPCMPKYGLKYGLWSEMAAFMQLSSGVRIALIQLIIKSHWAMIREKFDNNIHMVRSYILWIEFFATIYRCSDYSGHGGQDHWCAQTTSWHWQWVATSDTGWPHVTREPPHKRVLQTFTQHSLHKPFLWFPLEKHTWILCNKQHTWLVL